MSTPLKLLGVTALLMVALLRCAPAVSPLSPARSAVTIRLDNTSFDRVTIYVVGRRSRRLTDVEGMSSTTAFVTFEDLKPDGQYRLVARKEFGGAFASVELFASNRPLVRLAIQSREIFTTQ